MAARRGVHVYVHGRGRGHATRCGPVIEALAARGEPVRVFGGPGAVRALAGSIDVEPVDSLPPKPTAAGVRILAQRTGAALRALRADRPRALVSDGDHPALIAAGLARVPALALGHGLVFSCCRRPEGLPADAWAREARKARLSSFPARAFVAVSFCALEVARPDCHLAQPDLPAEIASAAPRPARPEGRTVVAYFRERDGRRVLEALRRHLSDADRVLAFGDTEVPPGVERHPEGRRAFVDALLDADLVLGTAGSNLIAECVQLGRPFFALYPPEHDEQRLNAELLEAAGLGGGSPIEPFDERALQAFLTAPPAPVSRARFAPTPSELVPRLLESIAP